MSYIDRGTMYNHPMRNDYVSDTMALLDREHQKAKVRRMAYTVSTDAEERRAAFRAMLGFPLSPMPEKNEITVKKELLCEGEHFVSYRMQLEIIEGVRLGGILLEPKVKKEKNPFVIFQHGGLGTSEMITGMIPPTNYHDFAMNTVEAGYYVFAPQLFHWRPDDYGSPYKGDSIDCIFRLLGGSKTAFGVYGIIRAIDYFSALPEIDENRIGMAGLSYGGMYTLVTSALDTRIKVAVSACFVNNRLNYAWNDWSYFGQAQRFLDPEILTLVSPRKILVEVGKNDELFACGGLATVEEDVTYYKDAMGLPDFCAFHVFEGGHAFGTDGANLRFLTENL